MKKLKLLVFITACLLVTSIFAVLPAFSGQPPLNTLTMFTGTIGQPKNVDPSQAYDTASGELIMNVYDSILEFGSQSTNVTNKPTFTVPANGSVNVGTQVAVLGAATDVPGVGSLPEVHSDPPGNSTWTFKINTALVFQDWMAPNGTTVTGEHMTAADVVYYFQRMCVQDSHNSPEWMFFGPAFGLGSFDTYQDAGGPSLGANESLVASFIQNWVSGFTNATGDYVQFRFLYAAVGLWDIWCQTWSCVPPMLFSIDHGCWNGTFYPGWSADYRRFPVDRFTPLDVHTRYSQYASRHAEPAMCGTGPYSFTYWNQATNEWRIDAFLGCVSHPWPGPYGAGSPAPQHVIETGINTWPTRKMMFLAGDSDMTVVNRASMYDLLQGANAYLPISGIQLFYNISALKTDAIFYTFNISAGSMWMPTVTFVNGSNLPDPTLFNDIRVRWAFNQALNNTDYIIRAWYGEAIHPNSWWALGLTPADAYLNFIALPSWDINLNNIYGNLTAAGIIGFRITLMYNTGNDQRRLAVQAIADTFNQINALHNNVNYICTVASEDWPAYLSDAASNNLPLFNIGWLADFSDADDFAVPFMATWGALASWQKYSNSTIDFLIATEEAYAAAPVNLTLGSPYELRNDAFKALQYDYYQQAISLPTVQPVGRHWQRDWVQGYYVNQLYPGFYYQDLYKKTATVYTPINLELSSMTGTRLYPWVNESLIYIYKGQMNIWHGGGLPATIVFTIHIDRTDTAFAIPAMATVVGIYRFNLTDLSSCVPKGALTLEYPNSTLVFVPPYPAYINLTLQWYEDGVLSTLPANATWQLGGRCAVWPGAPGYDTNSSDNTINAGFNVTAYTTTAKGTYYAERADVNGDGKVDQLDAMLLSNSYGKTGPPGWIPADVMPDGVVDYFDALMVARMFGWTVESSSSQPCPPEPWNLTISTPPGQSQNDSVVVYSDYIVYSNYSFSPALKQLSFNIASSIDGFCNVTIPKTSMSGNFTVYLDDEPTPCTVTQSATCYFLYFTSTGLSQQVRIVSEYADALIGDVNHDGRVNILDAILLSNAFLATPSSPNWNPNTDFNGDGVVDILDSIIMSNNWTG
jgi:peptide/nickel transport system substrate-binding protein